MSIVESALDRLRKASAVQPSPEAAALSQRPRAASGETDEAAALSRPPRRVAIDFDALREQGELPERGQERRFADYYREIKRPLIQKALAGDALPDSRLILVTSALPGEGKTFTALNLALSIAHERDVSVLLVDADVPKVHLSLTFGIQDEPGLIDALANEALDVDSLVLGTDVRGLEVLSAGKAARETAAELIASVRMGQIAARLTARHPRRLVLFDSAPLLVSSEARALKQVPGEILLVTRAGRTPRQALLDAIALIDKAKLHGLVLNDAYIARGHDYYDHYGYSGYSGYGGEGEPSG
jgi:protein-tyrosine kinase